MLSTIQLLTNHSRKGVFEVIETLFCPLRNTTVSLMSNLQFTVSDMSELFTDSGSANVLLAIHV